MPQHPRPWKRNGRGWYVQIDRRQVFLGKNRKRAYERYHELMRRPQKRRVSGDYVLAVIDAFRRAGKSHDFRL